MTTVSATDRQRVNLGPRRWLIVAVVWTSVALFSVLHIWVARAALGHPPPLAPLLTLELPVWLFWALLTVPIVMLARRFPLDRTRIRRSVLLHGAAAIAFAVASVTFQMLWYQAFNPYPLGGSSVSAWFWQYFRQYFIIGFVIYWAVVGVYHAFANYFLYRERELEASRATAQLTEARLNALKMQLHPHFLFNTLNSVSSLLEAEPREARRVLAQLADLLRASLKADVRHVIPLADEMQFLNRYLDIERVRFGDRLDVTLRMGPDTERAAIPSFLFQPLVENALRHGIARREAGGRMWISASRADGSLVIHVMDNGPGIARGPVSEGIGLANTRRRLRELYGDEQSLSLCPRPGGGVDVRVELPFRMLGRDA
jgi:signal transduction histidine kinase